MSLILAAALTVGVVAAAMEKSIGNGIALTAVIAAATIAYSGFTWRLVKSAETDRRARAKELVDARRDLLISLGVELAQNMLRHGQTHAWYAHVPFERAALDAARPARADLPAGVKKHLHEVETRIARFNTVAGYNETQVGMGSGAADPELTRLAGEVHDSLVVAYDSLTAYLGSA